MGERPEPPLNTLIVNRGTNIDQTAYLNALLQLCQRFEVENLFFSTTSLPASLIGTFLAFGKTGSCYFLPHLKAITIEDSVTYTEIQAILQYARVIEINWRIPGYRSAGLQSFMQSVFYSLSGTEPSFETYWSVRDFRILYDYRGQPASTSCWGFQTYDWQHKNYRCKDHFEIWLKRNSDAFKKCQKATKTLLGLKKLQKYKPHRDVLDLIVQQVWNTRGTSVWKE